MLVLVTLKTPTILHYTKSRRTSRVRQATADSSVADTEEQEPAWMPPLASPVPSG